MNEAEWLACTDPEPMLEFLEEKVGNRKLRLFAVACCRRIWHLFRDRRSRNAVEVAEQFSDDRRVSEEDLAAAMVRAEQAHMEAPSRWGMAPFDAAINAADDDLSASAGDAAFRAADAVEAEAKSAGPQARAEERGQQTVLIRCIFGNPFRPVTLAPLWRTPSVLALATAAYDERILPAGHLEPDRLAILADALEDAGCTSSDILGHLRGPGPHLRGCWPVDLILGKK